MSNTEKLKEIKDEILEMEGFLAKQRRDNSVFPVIGEGNHDADIIFIGEAPGKNEAETGRPFCGAAGRILDELLNHISLERGSVYVTNIVKDRPPSNRDPSKEEIDQYGPYLDRQIEIIKPKVIATLGRFSMEYVMKRYDLESKLDSISKIHGKSFTNKKGLKVIPLYHPAVALYNRATLDSLKNDFEILKSEIN